MVIYFSGTSNSKFIAQSLAEKLQDKIFSMNEAIKNSQSDPVFTGDHIVLVTPTYAWRIPKLVSEWMKKTVFPSAAKIWFVMNCGDEIGNAAHYNRKLSLEKGLTYMGTVQIIMPENYIAMFDTPALDEARAIVDQAKPLIENVARLISAGEVFPEPKNNLYYRILSGIINPAFYPVCVKAKKFIADDKCIGCGKCIRLCPLNNISLEDKKPVWAKQCTHCMACIAYCPTQAIEYGKKSIGQVRYSFEKL